MEVSRLLLQALQFLIPLKKLLVIHTEQIQIFVRMKIMMLYLENLV